MDRTISDLDPDARASVARFSRDVYRVVVATNVCLPATRLVTSYESALECNPGEPDARKAWSRFYLWLEFFTRTAVRSIEPQQMPSVLPALLRFEEILGDDFGSRLFATTERNVNCRSGVGGD